MGKGYYGDTLDHVDKVMDYDHEDVFKQDPLKDLSFKVKSSAGKKTNMSNACDFVKGKTEGSWEVKHKTELKHECCEQLHSSMTVSNKEFVLGSTWHPADFNNNGQHTSVEAEAKCNPGKQDWEFKAEAQTGGFELGPVKPWAAVSISSLIHIFLVQIRNKQGS